MARKFKNIEGYFARLRKVYEEVTADDPRPGLLDESDGDRRILAHAVFYIFSRPMVKKMDGMGPFELLRLFEERMLRIFIADPNSERVDQLLEKADLLYELLPYSISQCIDEGAAEDEHYIFTEDALYETQGLLVASGAYANGVEEDELDRVLDSLSLRTGNVGSPIIEANAAEIMQRAKNVIYGSDYAGVEDEAATIAELRGLDVERQMLVIGLMSINMDAIVKGLDTEEVQWLSDDIAEAISAFDDGESPEEIEECIDFVIESIKDVIDYIMDENRPHNQTVSMLCCIFTGMLTVYIHDAHDLSDEDFAEVWSEVRHDGKFDDDALISYSRKIIDRDLPDIIREFNESQQ